MPNSEYLSQTAICPDPAMVTDMDATLFVALELSLSSWVVVASAPGEDKASKHGVAACDGLGLLAVLKRLRERAERRLGHPVGVLVMHSTGQASLSTMGAKRKNMMLKRRGFVSCGICAAIGLAASSTDVAAQNPPPGFTRKILQKTEYPGDKYLCILVEVDIEPNAIVARHTHPGVESGYLVFGSSILSVKGQSDRALEPGEAYQVPPETPHSVRNGPGKSRVAATFIVEKDKPLASPAPD